MAMPCALGDALPLWISRRLPFDPCTQRCSNGPEEVCAHSRKCVFKARRAKI